MKVSWDDYSQYMEKSNSCSKPPTSFREQDAIAEWFESDHAQRSQRSVQLA